MLCEKLNKSIAMPTVLYYNNYSEQIIPLRGYQAIKPLTSNNIYVKEKNCEKEHQNLVIHCSHERNSFNAGISVRSAAHRRNGQNPCVRRVRHGRGRFETR